MKLVGFLLFLEFTPTGMDIMNNECDPAPSFYPLLRMSLESKSYIKSKWEQKATKDFNEFIFV